MRMTLLYKRWPRLGMGLPPVAKRRLAAHEERQFPLLALRLDKGFMFGKMIDSPVRRIAVKGHLPDGDRHQVRWWASEHGRFELAFGVGIPVLAEYHID